MQNRIQTEKNKFWIYPQTGGNYSVTVTDSNGCTATQTVSVSSTAAVSATVSGTQSSCGNNNGSAAVNASGGINYVWSNGATSTIISVSPGATSRFCVTGHDSVNCSDTACAIVFIEPYDCSGAGELFLPNAFSPNVDNENDTYRLRYGSFSCIKSYLIIIYDRWGEKVFESTNPADEWDGTFREKPAETAAFVYYMKAVLASGEEITRKGNISLFR